MSALDPRALLGAARKAAWLYTPPALEHWRDEIASDVAERVVRRLQTEAVAPSFVYRTAAFKAIRHLTYLLRGQAERVDDYGDDDVWQLGLLDGRPELGPIALWRLQALWEDLTDIQRLAMTWYLSGDSLVDVARENGVHNATLVTALKSVLRRLDGAQFTRRGRRARLAGRPPMDPKAVAAAKASDAAAARARRAAFREVA